MKTKIANEDDFMACIDQLGDVQALIAKRQAEAKSLKGLLEEYANGTKTWKCETDAYRFEMKRGAPSLVLAKDVRKEDALALLKDDEVTKAFVIETYDGEAIKAYAKKAKDGGEFLAVHGLALTEPNRHAAVKPL